MRYLLLLLFVIAVACAAPLDKPTIPYRISANPERLLSTENQAKSLHKMEIKEQFIRLEEDPFIKTT